MTRRERLERKAELRREWAAKRLASSQQHYAASNAAVDGIPLGQPILVGHHSEKRHRAAVARAQSHMSKSCEDTSMASHHESKADGIERQLETAIFSDDDGAADQLREKIAALEKERAFYAAANTIVRRKPKNELTEEKVTELIALGVRENAARKLFEADYCGRFGFPSYLGQNLSGRIADAKKRIEHITARTERAEQAEAKGGLLIEGTEYVRVTFSEKPSRDVLDSLKAAGFHWSGGSWCGRRDKLPDTIGTDTDQ